MSIGKIKGYFLTGFLFFVQGIPTYGTSAQSDILQVEDTVRVEQVDVKCSVFNGMALLTPELSDVAVDMGSGKISFQVRHPITRFYTSYDSKKHSEFNALIQSYKHQLQEVLAGAGRSEKDSGVSYDLQRIAPSVEDKQALMGRILSSLTPSPFVIATGAWRIAGIQSNQNLKVLTAQEEIKLTALSLQLKSLKTDLTLTGAAGIAAGTKSFIAAQEKIGDFTNTRQIRLLAQEIKSCFFEEESAGNITVLGILFDNISRLIQFSQNPILKGRRNQTSKLDVTSSLFQHPFAAPVHLHSGTSSTICAAKLPQSEMDSRIGVLDIDNLIPYVQDHEQASIASEVVIDALREAGKLEGDGKYAKLLSTLSQSEKLIYRNFMMMMTTVLTGVHNDLDFRGTDLELIVQHKQHLRNVLDDLLYPYNLRNLNKIPENLELQFDTVISCIEKHDLSIQILRSFSFEPEHVQGVLRKIQNNQQEFKQGPK